MRVSKREAKRIAEEDATPYGVLRNGNVLYRVTGYQSAKVIRGTKGDAVILTESEMKRMGR